MLVLNYSVALRDDGLLGLNNDDDDEMQSKGMEASFADMLIFLTLLDES